MEGASCLRWVQRELIEGRLTLGQAIARLRACDDAGPKVQAALAARSPELDSVGAKVPPGADLFTYTEDIRNELFLLEEARLRYLDAAGRAHRWTGSIGRFITSLRQDDGAVTSSDWRAEALDLRRGQISQHLQRLEEMGLDPALLAMAETSVGRSVRLSAACATDAYRKARWVRTGAGVVTALTGAATVVVASGAVGTIIGGLTIAAALEAAGGAYLSYHSERETLRGESSEQVAQDEPPSLPEKEPFTRRDRPESLAMGAQGEGQGELQDLLEGGRWEETAGARAGEGDEFYGDAPATEPEPRPDSVPAELPEAPDAVLELPGMLNAAAFSELERLSLPEAQARLDEFLSLAAMPARVPDRDLPASEAATSQLIEEASAALRLWVEARELSSGFGSFFVRAEMADVPADERRALLSRVLARYERDRSMYRESATIEELRQRLAERLVVHCRAGPARGDLMLQACADPTALTLIVVGAMRDAEIAPPAGTVLGVQAVGPDFHAVLYSAADHAVTSLVSGTRTAGVTAPIYHPASFYYGFLAENGATPEIDPEEHLLIVRPDPGAGQPIVPCEAQDDRNVFGKIYDWLRSLVGAGSSARAGAACGPDSGGIPGRNGGGDSEATSRTGVHVTLSLPRPSIPVGGGGQGGGGQGGGGGGAGNGTPGGSAGGQSGSGGGGGSATDGAQSGAEKAGAGGAGGTPPAGGAEQGGGSDGGAGGRGSGGSGDSAGHSATGSSVSGPDLIRVAGETLNLARAAEGEAELRLRPWRLREDQSFIPSAGWVLYADNERAMDRFGPNEQFVTMSPSSTEEQRRMFAADSFPVYPVGTSCEAPALPPRGVFRRATNDDSDFRYVYCDHDESIIAFRSNEEARTYAELSAPDRPLLLTRLSSDRIASYQNSPRVEHLQAFLRDPDVIHALTVEQVDSLVSTTTQLLWLQERLEAALLQSMGELEGSGVREYYYELHRQVAQSPFLLELVESIYRFNRRLASDPLRTLAWADALPDDHRQKFFELYSALGAIMYWPDRWETLHERYAGGPPLVSVASRDSADRSLDFLQVMSDPTRVQVDWPQERQPTSPSIRDTRPQDGAAHAEDERERPTTAEEQRRQEITERRRGGTGGLGRTGQGKGLGPERGTQPLQMIRITVKTEDGNPDRPRFPDDNPTRPGGTEGERKVQEKSASRQEPALWLSPETFVDAILSGWDPPRGGPATAERVPPVVRFSPRLRELFLREMNEGKLYESRLTHAVGILTAGGWLKYDEIRDAMGGEWAGVRAFDTGRYTVEYSTAAAVVDQSQVRGPNFFTHTSVVLPADLVTPVRSIFNRSGVGNFDLEAVTPKKPVELPAPIENTEDDAAARERLMRALELISAQTLSDTGDAARRGSGTNARTWRR